MKEITGYRNNNFSEIGANKVTLKELLNQEIIDNGNELMIDDVFEACQQEQVETEHLSDEFLIDMLHDMIQTKVNNKNVLYGVWLCEKPEHIQKYYWHNETDDEVKTYSIPKNSLCLCDLGCEGKLFVIEKPRHHYLKNNQKEG